MPHNDTATVEGSFVFGKLYLYSGQFSSTLLTSEDVASIATDKLTGISWDGANTPWITETSKLYLTSGQFSSTLKTSQSVSPSLAKGISYDGANTPWTSPFFLPGTVPKLKLTSGQFSSTLKTSQSVGLLHDHPTSISWDEVNSPWSAQLRFGSGSSNLFLTSGQFSSTLKDSEDITAIDNQPKGITWDGVNTPWAGEEADKFYLTSGQFTSTIKTSVALIFNKGAEGIETLALNLSCDVTGTIVTSATDETDIVDGGRTIILTLNTGRLNPQSDTWGATMGADNPITQALIDGLDSSGIEVNGWNAVVRAGLTFPDVVRTSDSVVTITLPAFAAYDIALDEAVTVTVPALALTGGNGPLTAVPPFVVAAQIGAASIDTLWTSFDPGEPTDKLFLQSGQFTSTIKDSEDVTAIANAESIASTGVDTPWLDDNEKAYLTSGQFTATLKTSLDVNSVDSDANGISWDGVNTPISGNSGNKLYLTSGQFTTTIKDSVAIGAIDFTPRGISYDGTNTPWAGQLNLMTFGDTLYLQSGQFTSTLKTSLDVNAIDNSVQDISFSGTTGDTPWAGTQADKLYLTSGQFSSTLHDSEDVSGVTNGIRGIDVNDRLAAGVALLTVTGSVLPSVTEQDIRNGAKTIVLTLSSETWVATVGADNAITQALIDGLVSDAGEVRGWNNIVRDGLNAANVTRVSGTIVIVTLPIFSDYDISSEEEITATAPAVALTGGAALIGAPSFAISIVPVPAPRRVARAKYENSEWESYISPDGIEYPFHTPHNLGRWVISQTGWGTPPIQYITQRGPFQHGVTVKDFFLQPRVIQLLIRQAFCDRDAWWDGRAALLNEIRPNRQTISTAVVPGRLQRCLPDGTLRAIEVFISDGPRFEQRVVNTWDEWAFQEVLRFIAHDPVIFDPTRNDVNFTIGLDSALVFPITFPIQFGVGDIDDTLSINYVGTWESLPIIVITGPIEQPRIDNLTTGEKLEFSIDIDPAQVVTIDLSYGSKTVLDQDGNNLIGGLTADSDLATFHIAPDPEAPLGVNQMRLQGTHGTGTTDIEIRYFDRYFGI